MHIIDIARSLMRDVLKIRIINKKTEKILYSITAVLITTLIISQVGLLNKSTRTFFTNMEKYEGVDIDNINELLKDGELKLELIGIEPTSNIKILINGYEAYEFTDKNLNIKVKNNSVVEIDGTKVNLQFKVKIIDVTDNIATNCINTEIEINTNIAVLTRILFKDNN